MIGALCQAPEGDHAPTLIDTTAVTAMSNCADCVALLRH